MSLNAKIRWTAWRNRTLANPRFQAFAARFPIIRRVARKRARSLFDLVAGFTYSQIVLAVVERGLLDRLAEGPLEASEIGAAIGLGLEATERLLRAAKGLDLVEEIAPGRWMLGQQGAVLQADTGVRAMVSHHRLLYADLADPFALLRADRGARTALSDFWTYVGKTGRPPGSPTPYSELMASSQTMVSREATASYVFGRHRAVLDIGGGHGRFASHLVSLHPTLRLGIVDLPEVVAGTAKRLDAPGRIALHPGDFFRDPLPQGYDCHTLVRILHDHDDAQAAQLLAASRSALPPGGTLVIIEPMAGMAGAEPLGSYFELYLWAMGSGRPRTAEEIGTMVQAAGFAHWRLQRTRQPMIASIIVCHV